ncbi:hypothetical protein BCR34DRAFT_324208 [Clohesyomyces aquaticus]|uniref:Ribosomal protein L37e-domain-containing protein n=1 Tax=Clohesyomyces aquaticus TaxID=1231657 RepID=A0A1Y1ZMR2_9PLEO|nr:hypothetical protein BCR34DRAFT_324208 [Clohesyomyces aquaticus]
MTKGTSSFGKRHNKTHTLCRRCGMSKPPPWRPLQARGGHPSLQCTEHTNPILTVSIPGRRSLHIQKHTCSSCGYPAAKVRKFNWGEKAKRRKTTGTGRMRYLKTVPRRFSNGFRTGAPAGARGPTAAAK